MNTSNIVATVDFSAQMSVLAGKADNQALTSTCAVLLLVRDSGGTNKKSMSALWALLPDTVVNTFQQAKRINGALNAPAEKATDGAKVVRALWLGAKNQTAFVKGLVEEMGVTSPRALLDLVAPRKDPKAPAVKSAVETFLQAAKGEGFKESVLPLLVWIAERHSVEMARLLAEAEAFQAGKQAEAEAARAEAEAKQEKIQAAKAAKDAAKAAKDAAKAEKTAQAERDASEAKSRKARADHAEKQAHEHATHPKVRQIIEA